MPNPNPSPKLLDYAVNLLSYRPRSEAEIRLRLKRKQIPAAEIDTIINTLKDMKLLDDQEFCLWWQEVRDKHRPRSSRILKLELRQKGVDRAIIEAAIDTSTATEKTRASLALQKKYANRDLSQNRAKVIRFLASRGFSWDTISQVIKPQR
ncbi:MAG: regulatory protein RecX [Candidatus Chisholmbacteria bacterium]|nr:regulatory protein RecX [Candidatus Chisholmbacteria bacterium]